MKKIHDTFTAYSVSDVILEPMLNGYLHEMAQGTILSPDFEGNPDYLDISELEVDESVSQIISGRVTSFYMMLLDRRSWLFNQLQSVVIGSEHPFTWNDVGTYLYAESYGIGVGFWDRKELEDNDLGEKLSEFVKEYFDYVGSGELYIGDDQKIYL